MDKKDYIVEYKNKKGFYETGIIRYKDQTIKDKLIIVKLNPDLTENLNSNKQKLFILKNEKDVETIGQLLPPK